MNQRQKDKLLFAARSKGGASQSPAKVKAARRNGMKGGRPKKMKVDMRGAIIK